MESFCPHSPVAQWQSTELLTLGFLVQVQVGEYAILAQLVEQGFCKAQVAGSSPVNGFPLNKGNQNLIC
tara:strand:- start:706 stop:912 length:207 start_codon:yes stop_codon:yes gene_type:complete